MTAPRSSPVFMPRRLAFALVVALLPLLTVEASSPVFWRVSTQDEFLRGEADNVSIDADGRVSLGPETEPLYDPGVPFLWDASSGGEALWIGSGSDGKVFRLRPDGSATTAFDAAEQNVHAVVAEPDGTAVVGTSPTGAVFRVEDGQSAMLFDPDDTYIWDIALGSDGALFVATGDQGKIYRIGSDGRAALFYDADATHALALTFDAAGRLVAGTGNPGQVVRIDAEGRGFVLLDSPFAEIRSLRVAPDGALYAVAVGQSPSRTQAAPSSTPPQRSAGVPSVTTSTTVTAVVVADATRPAETSAPAASSASTEPQRGAVYRIQPDGVWDTIWESSQDAPYDVVVDERGNVLVGTGASGKIYEVRDDPPRVVLLARADAQQVTAFAAGPERSRYYVTSNPGKVYRQAGDRASQGNYVSEVRDAGTVATWGTVRWRARVPEGTSLRLFTRAGNTASPNATWSRWSEAYTEPSGSQISSPKARYLQWKAEFEGNGDSPTLLSVTTAYLPQNLRPEVTSLTVHDPGVAFQQPFSSGDPPIAGLDDLVDARTRGEESSGGDGQTTLGRRVYRKGLQTIVWTARDPNQDTLSFDVLYRSESDLSWHQLRRGVTDSIFTWDTTSVPDGTYLVRVVATDAQGNAPGAALTGAAESTPFDIDNSPPRIEIEPITSEGDRVVVTFTVRDSHTAVDTVEYSTDAEHWQVLYPVDGIADSRSERFELSVTDADAARARRSCCGRDEQLCDCFDVSLDDVDDEPILLPLRGHGPSSPHPDRVPRGHAGGLRLHGASPATRSFSSAWPREMPRPDPVKRSWRSKLIAGRSLWIPSRWWPT